jgi:gamma-glutamylcyclotransferase (GGCT)/AIG2-like uncharacterized protein YtfP
VTRKLFCYGTLMLSDIMQSVARCKQTPRPALLHDYACYRVRDAVYPGIVYEPGGLVFGVVYNDINPQQLAAIDRYEGPIYRRKMICVHLEGGNPIPAWGYLIADEYRRRLTDEPWDIQDFVNDQLL